MLSKSHSLVYIAAAAETRVTIQLWNWTGTESWDINIQTGVGVWNDNGGVWMANWLSRN